MGDRVTVRRRARRPELRGQILRTSLALVVPSVLYVLVLFLSSNSLGAVHLAQTTPTLPAAGGSTTVISEPAGASAATTAAAISQAVGSASAPAASSNGQTLSLHVGVAPSTICANNDTSCSAGTPTARVTLSAAATNNPTPYWPDVQVAFIVETTAYDGVFDHYNSFYGQDSCAASTSGQGPVCEESNGVPFFIANGGIVAQAIQSQNPRSNVSFALVDFFGTDCGDWDDCGDGYKYHVDIPQFVPADAFGSAVRSTFQAEVLGGGWDGIFGLDDNFLHSPSITALYGTIIGSGLSWSAGAHHVIVLLGSTAPRDPAYAENYWVSAFDHCCSGSTKNGWTCEPAYVFSNGASPNCEGWVKSQDGNPNDSIAALAHTATQCTESIGHVCTIDTIDYWDTATDPQSQGWPTSPGYPSGTAGAGPGGSGVETDVEHVVLAGCDLAAATGGTWDGPAFESCPDGQAGTLQYVPHGPLSNPNTVNPTLFNALKVIGFGPIYQTLAANGTGKPIFQFVPIGNIAVSPDPQYTAACSQTIGFLTTCQTVPSISHQGGVTMYGWNWSTNKTQNAMYSGDEWTASFNIVDRGPPYTIVPVDACTTSACAAGHSGAVNGLFTWANYRPGNNGSAIIASFPLGSVEVELTASPAPPPIIPTAPPIAPPGLPIVVAPATPVVVPTLTVQSIGISNISLQAASAGFLGAGFMKVSMKNRPIAMRMAALTKPASSKFEKEAAAASSGVGRFE